MRDWHDAPEPFNSEFRPGLAFAVSKAHHEWCSRNPNVTREERAAAYRETHDRLAKEHPRWEEAGAGLHGSDMPLQVVSRKTTTQDTLSTKEDEMSKNDYGFSPDNFGEAMELLEEFENESFLWTIGYDDETFVCVDPSIRDKIVEFIERIRLPKTAR